MKSELDYDEDVPLVLENRWKIWPVNLKDISEIKLPHWIGFVDYKKVKIGFIIFCHVSKLAYRAVINLNVQTINYTFLLANND